MLKDSEERRIISSARQKNIRNPDRSREHFVRIFEDFFGDYDFSEKRWLDLGPGHYDFAEMVRERRGDVVNIDRDAAVLKLGRYKGFIAVEGDLEMPQRIELDYSPFDGVFCKFSINAFWYFADPGCVDCYASWICGLLKNDGAAWIAPWNGVPSDANLNDNEVERIVALQQNSFVGRGFEAIELDSDKAKYYGINGNVANNIIFTRGI